jgi:hypothetical protein
MRTAFNWLVAKFTLRKQKKHEVRQLAQYHPFMFGKL